MRPWGLFEGSLAPLIRFDMYRERPSQRIVHGICPRMERILVAVQLLNLSLMVEAYSGGRGG